MNNCYQRILIGIPIVRKSIRGVHNEKLIHTYARFIHDDSVSSGSGRVGWKLDRSGGWIIGWTRDRLGNFCTRSSSALISQPSRILGTLQHRKHNQQLSRRNQSRLSSEPFSGLQQLATTSLWSWKEWNENTDFLIYIYIYIYTYIYIYI